jgi:hypothetical protein
MSARFSELISTRKRAALAGIAASREAAANTGNKELQMLMI